MEYTETDIARLLMVSEFAVLNWVTFGRIAPSGHKASESGQQNIFFTGDDLYRAALFEWLARLGLSKVDAAMLSRDQGRWSYFSDAKPAWLIVIRGLNTDRLSLKAAVSTQL